MCMQAWVCEFLVHLEHYKNSLLTRTDSQIWSYLILTIIRWSKWRGVLLFPFYRWWDWDSASTKSWKWHSQYSGTKVCWLWVFIQQTLFLPCARHRAGLWRGAHWGLTLTPARSSGSKAYNAWALSRSVSSMLLSKLGMADADVLSYMLLKRQAIFFQPSPPKSEKSVKGWQESVHWWDYSRALYTSSL